MRADATENRRRILDAARTLLATEGAAVRVEAVAARAGVAVGTVYRHFATKDALVAAAVERVVEAMVERVERAVADTGQGSPAGPALTSLFTDLAAAHADDQSVKAAAAALGAPVVLDVATLPAGSRAADGLAALEGLLERARREDGWRRDLTVADLLMFLEQVPGAEHPPALRDTYVRVVLAGASGGGSA